MAFVPYIPSIRYIPASSPSSYSSILQSTSSTYVYSRPLPSSHLKNASLCQEQPAELKICEGIKAAVQPREAKDSLSRRTHFTVLQRRELEKLFSQSQYITPQKREAISQQLGIPKEVIQTWFKNRRVKWRKEQQKRQTGSASSNASLTTGLYFHCFGHVPYPSSKLILKDARMLYGLQD